MEKKILIADRVHPEVEDRPLVSVPVSASVADSCQPNGIRVVHLGGKNWVVLPQDPIPVSQILLHRTQGPVPPEGVQSLITGPNSLQRAELQIAEWAEMRPGRGYHKCLFDVIWKDGTSYTGIYRIETDGLCDGRLFNGHLFSRLRHYAGLAPGSGTWQTRHEYLIGTTTDRDNYAKCRLILSEYEFWQSDIDPIFSLV